jgi:hypothetical protein
MKISKNSRRWFGGLLTAVFSLALINNAPAQIVDTFGSGADQFSLNFVPIGNAGNAADPNTGYGAVLC